MSTIKEQYPPHKFIHLCKLRLKVGLREPKLPKNLHRISNYKIMNEKYRFSNDFGGPFQVLPSFCRHLNAITENKCNDHYLENNLEALTCKLRFIILDTFFFQLIQNQ